MSFQTSRRRSAENCDDICETIRDPKNLRETRSRGGSGKRKFGIGISCKHLRRL